MEVLAKPTDAQIKNLRCVIIPTDFKNCPKQFAFYYAEAYRLWKSIWAHTFKTESKIEEPEMLFSDNYLLQDEVICLFSENKAIGVVSLALLDLNCTAHRELSYFSDYPAEILEKLTIETPNILAVSALAIDKNWCRRTVGFRVSEVLVGYTVKRFLETSAEIFVAITRNYRRVNEMIYHYGGQPLCEGILSHGVGADISAIYRDKAAFNRWATPVQTLMNDFWKVTIIIGFSTLAGIH